MGCSKKNRENHPKQALELRNRETRIKISGLVLISFRTTGPRTITPSCLRSSIPLSLYATDRHTIILIEVDCSRMNQVFCFQAYDLSL